MASTMQILKYKPIESKGPLQGHFSIKIQKWGNFIIHDMSYFKKDNQSWVKFPSKKYEKDAETKYFSYVTFEDENMYKEFTKNVKHLLEEFIQNQNTKSVHEIVDLEIPF